MQKEFYMSKIYHFTSIDSFTNIINSNVLFFSKISSCSNDPSEGRYQQEYIFNYIKNNYLNYNLTLFNMNTTKNLLLNLYTISLSLDLYNIHNWMEYGNYGNGIAIEFDKEKLEQFIEKLSPFMNSRKVEYIEKNINNNIKKVFDDKESPDIKLLLLYPFIKHRVYKCEKEYRIAFVGNENAHKNDEVPDDIELPVFCYNYDYNRFGLRIDFLISDKIITKIIFGPNVTLYNENRIKKICKNRLKFSKCLVPIKKVK